MPGGRLTDEERRQVATGLADDLGYAEIARRLGRPTSTITREVARNGGARAYRADRAHVAARHRARRGSRAPAVPRPEADDAARQFVDRFATLMVQTGMPRMAARVFASLVTTEGGALTSAELVHDLRVSPASVSKAVGYLEGLELIARERGQRRERYVIDDDVWLHTWMTSARTNAMWADAAGQGAALFGVATRAGTRLERMRQFFAQLSDDMSGGPTESAVNDARTLLAALMYAGRPVTADRLATALDWSPERLAGAVHDAELYPDLTDPVTLERAGSGAYSAGVRADRLTAAQRTSIRDVGNASAAPSTG
jgi:Helix-turn-helix domain/MarR family